MTPAEVAAEVAMFAIRLIENRLASESERSEARRLLADKLNGDVERVRSAAQKALNARRR